MIKKILAILCSNTFSRLDEFLQIFGADLEGFLPIYVAFGESLEKVREFLDAKCAGRFWELNRLAKEHGADKLPALLLQAPTTGLARPPSAPRKTGIHTLQDVKPSDDGGGDDPHGGGGGGMVENVSGSTVTLSKTVMKPKPEATPEQPKEEPKPESPPTLHLVLRLRGMPEEEQIQIVEPPNHASQDAAEQAMGLYTRLIKLMMTAFQGTVGEEIAFTARDRLSVEQLLGAPTDDAAFGTVYDAIAELIQIVFASAFQVHVWEDLQRRLEQYVQAVESHAGTSEPAEEIVHRLRLPSRRQVAEIESSSASSIPEGKQEIEDKSEKEKELETLEIVDAPLDAPPEQPVNPGWEIGRKQIAAEVDELLRRLRRLYLATVGDDRLATEVQALEAQVKKLLKRMKTLGTAGPAGMKEIRLLMSACEQAEWVLARSLKEMIQIDADLAQLLREERAKYKKKKAPSQSGGSDVEEDEDDDTLKVTWSWGSTIEGQMTALQKDPIWGEIEPITHIVGQSKYVSVQGGFVDHGGLQKFHCVGTKLYECYLSTKELGSGSELRCFFRVDIRRYKDGRVWVHFTIVAVADHILKNVKPRSEDFGKRGDGPNLPPGFLD